MRTLDPRLRGDDNQRCALVILVTVVVAAQLSDHTTGTESEQRADRKQTQNQAAGHTPRGYGPRGEFGQI